MKTRVTLTVVMLSLVTVLVACDEQTVTGPGFVCDVTNPVRDLVLTPTSTILLVHSPSLATDTAQLSAVVTSRFGDPRTDVSVRFTSSDTTIATVDTLGVVHARRPGAARISASACGVTSAAQVTVVASVQRVVVSPASDTVIAGDTAFAVARAFAPNGSKLANVKFTFTSSSSTITVVQTSDSTAKFATSAAASATITALGEGVSGTESLLVLPRVFLAGSLASNTIDAGDATGCGLITLGHAFCWGLNNHGQIGAATDSTCFKSTDSGIIVNDSLVSTALPCSLLPLSISRTVNFTTISAGDSTACAISTAGQAYCWGMGQHGEIGNGSPSDKETPGLVTGALTFSTVSVGGAHACALTTSGNAYCWGDDTYGQLGDARQVSSTTPVPVSSGGGIASFVSISAGFRHTCAIASGGTAFCWGNNDFGQLGDGTASGSDTPVQVAGGLTFSSISAGGDHTCGVTTGGAAFCWGSNAAGQLGIGAAGSPSVVPVAVAGGISFARISASTGTQVTIGGLPAKEGHGHTCALSTAGVAFCWGDNTDLQLGRGEFTGADGVVPSPTQVAAGERGDGGTYSSISAGSRHSCAVGTDGNAYCWGSNVFGALGNTLQAAFRGQPQKVAAPR